MRLSVKGFLNVITTGLFILIVVPQTAISQTDTTEGFDGGWLPTNWSAPAGTGPTLKWYRSDDAFLNNAELLGGRLGGGHCAVFPTKTMGFSEVANLTWNNRNLSTFSTAYLNFYIKNVDGDDYIVVKANNTQVGNLTYGTYSNWSLIIINITTFAGNSSVTIKFEGHSETDVNSNIGIDDVSITTAPLPVQLASFSAKANRAATELRWTTATEVNNYGFDIERRSISNVQQARQTDGGQGMSNFERIGFVAGAGTSTSQREYTYVDQGLSSGRYAYRIKQVDFDGTSTYYGNAEVEIVAAKAFALEPNYPNPFNPSTTLSFTLAEDGRAVLRVFNVMGQEVATLFDEAASAGRLYQVSFNASHLPSGVYFARLESGRQLTMKKMLLVK